MRNTTAHDVSYINISVNVGLKVCIAPPCNASLMHPLPLASQHPDLCCLLHCMVYKSPKAFTATVTQPQRLVLASSTAHGRS